MLDFPHFGPGKKDCKINASEARTDLSVLQMGLGEVFGTCKCVGRRCRRLWDLWGKTVGVVIFAGLVFVGG